MPQVSVGNVPYTNPFKEWEDVIKALRKGNLFKAFGQYLEATPSTYVLGLALQKSAFAVANTVSMSVANTIAKGGIPTAGFIAKTESLRNVLFKTQYMVGKAVSGIAKPGMQILKFPGEVVKTTVNMAKAGEYGPVAKSLSKAATPLLVFSIMLASDSLTDAVGLDEHHLSMGEALRSYGTSKGFSKTEREIINYRSSTNWTPPIKQVFTDPQKLLGVVQSAPGKLVLLPRYLFDAAKDVFNFFWQYRDVSVPLLSGKQPDHVTLKGGNKYAK